MSNPYKASDTFLNICRSNFENRPPLKPIQEPTNPRDFRQTASKSANKGRDTKSQKQKERKRKRLEQNAEGNGKGEKKPIKQIRSSKEVKVISLLSDGEEVEDRKKRPPNDGDVRFGNVNRHAQQVPYLASDLTGSSTSVLHNPSPSSNYPSYTVISPDTPPALPSKDTPPKIHQAQCLEPNNISQFPCLSHNNLPHSQFPYKVPNGQTSSGSWNESFGSDESSLPPYNTFQSSSSQCLDYSQSLSSSKLERHAEHGWRDNQQVSAQQHSSQLGVAPYPQNGTIPANMIEFTPSSLPAAQQQGENSGHQDECKADTSPPAAREPPLSDEQRTLVDKIMSGRNVFYTGSAGVGKSTVLKVFVSRLRNQNKTVNIIAPTGRAALDINGSTFWTYAGWTPDSMKRPLKDLLAAAHGKFVWKRLMATDVLVIDEISMMENWHFERLNKLLKEARGGSDQPSHKAFGGVQLVVTGDFAQLPPVKPFTYCMQCGSEMIPLKGGTVYRCLKHGEVQDTEKWAFCSNAWEECRFEHINLQKIHRQSDEVFIKVLQKCRLGTPLDQKDKDLLLNHECKTNNAVKLFSTREEVKRVNDAQFNRLKSAKHNYKSNDFFSWNEKHANLKSKGQRNLMDGSLNALRDHRYEVSVDLKQGMLVVLLANLEISNGLVNGSQGVIVGFKDHEDSDLPEKKGGEGNLPEYFGYKQRSIKEFIKQSPKMKWPKVRFNNGITKTIIADCPVNELGDESPYSLISRTQVPLAAAWAVSIHKSQGMTLDRVIVDLSRSFEEGQMYVALSRARTLEGLKVEGLGSFENRGNEEVKRFLAEKFGKR